MNLEGKSKEELTKIAEGLTALRDRYKYNFIESVFPDTGPLRRELYPQHIKFLNGSSKANERLFSAANQVGKTLTGLYEVVKHATGDYPHWWEGKKFKRPTVGVLGADSWEHIRDGIQAKLFTGGDRGYLERGCGLIPKKILDQCTFRSKGQPPGVYSSMQIPHVSGGMSELRFRTYDRQEAWESMTLDYVILDEEPPRDIYTEAAMRVLAKNGTIAVCFTPDSGLTETVLHFFKNERFEAGAADGKLITMVGWDDVPHMSAETKEARLQAIPEQLRDAKTKGIPYLGAGRVFQFDLDTFKVDPFPIPEHYLRVFAIDPGVQKCAVLWAAIDPDTDVMYITDEFAGNYLSIYTVADAIKRHGQWIPGVIDPFYGTQCRESTKPIVDLYRETGLDIQLCTRHKNNYKEGGIESIKVKFLTGKLKIFKSCSSLLNQLSLYHRNDKGKTGNTPDDFVDALRYMVTGGKQRAISSLENDELRMSTISQYSQSINSAKRNKVTGY